ncbi:MAG: pectate lyase [Paludibacteraceae bacterium]|nr:pectate lyase [Paludibacteraceae bacterium]
MKRPLITLLCTLYIVPLYLSASVSDLSWQQVCSGTMPETWYGSQEAQDIADIVLAVQKENGGWMKNDQLHKLSDTEYQRLISEKNTHSCLDNFATTQEMRYLARVYQATGIDRYQTAFRRALQMIFNAQKGCGGWSQYWPLSGNYSYQDYITFNDDLMTNVMRILHDIASDQGVFANIVDAATRTQCQTAFDRGLQCVLDCQIDDNGVYAAWGAQHDTVAPYLPMEGRPHELPSVSGYESANLLSFLMSIDNPSETLKARITAAVTWLDAHKIADHAVEDYTNAAGEPDRRIIDQPGTHLWGRFIQIGGASGTTIYEHFFAKLKKRNASRSYTYNGVKYTYKEEEMARASYDPARAYQPIYAIYKDTIQHMYYRFLYNYEDTPKAIDDKGCPVYTSLMATNRASYQYIGSWPQYVIETVYPAWQARYQTHEEGIYILSAQTCLASHSDTAYPFNNAFSISNDGGKTYFTAKQNTIRYSADVTYTIAIPSDLQVIAAEIRGYCNASDGDAYLTQWNNSTYTTDYFFPRTDGGDSQWVTYYINMASSPARDTLPFRLSGSQTSMTISLTCTRRQAQGIDPVTRNPSPVTHKVLRNGQLFIIRDGRIYNALGQPIDQLTNRL